MKSLFFSLLSFLILVACQKQENDLANGSPFRGVGTFSEACSQPGNSCVQGRVSQKSGLFLQQGTLRQDYYLTEVTGMSGVSTLTVRVCRDCGASATQIPEEPSIGQKVAVAGRYRNEGRRGQTIHRLVASHIHNITSATDIDTICHSNRNAPMIFHSTSPPPAEGRLAGKRTFRLIGRVLTIDGGGNQSPWTLRGIGCNKTIQVARENPIPGAPATIVMHSGCFFEQVLVGDRVCFQGVTTEEWSMNDPWHGYHEFTRYGVISAATTPVRAFEELPPLPSNAEVHVRTVYSAGKNGGIVRVNVNRTGNPIVLALGAYGPTTFDVTLQPGVTLERVILNGYHEVRARGIPKNIPITSVTHDHLSKLIQAGGPKTLWDKYIRASREYDDGNGLSKLIRLLGGRQPTSFVEQYHGTEFQIN